MNTNNAIPKNARTQQIWVLFTTFCLIITLLLVNSQLYAQGNSEIRTYRVGSNEFPGTPSWRFIDDPRNITAINLSIIKRDDRFVLFTQSSHPLGEIRIVLNDNTVIYCARRPSYDHYIDNSLHSIYYLTEKEIQSLGNSDIDHILVTESQYPTLSRFNNSRGRSPRYYTYYNQYQGERNPNDWFNRSLESNPTSRHINMLLRHIGQPSSSIEDANVNVPTCNCETVNVQGNRSYMCAPEQIHVGNRVNLAIMMVESGDQKYIALNALVTGRAKKLDGSLKIEFDNDRTHHFLLENTQISRIGGEEVAQGVFRAIFTTLQSIRVADMTTVSFQFEGESPRTYRVTENSNALRQQYQCF